MIDAPFNEGYYCAVHPLKPDRAVGVCRCLLAFHTRPFFIALLIVTLEHDSNQARGTSPTVTFRILHRRHAPVFRTRATFNFFNGLKDCFLWPRRFEPILSSLCIGKQNKPGMPGSPDWASRPLGEGAVEDIGLDNRLGNNWISTLEESQRLVYQGSFACLAHHPARLKPFWRTQQQQQQQRKAHKATAWSIRHRFEGSH